MSTRRAILLVVLGLLAAAAAGCGHGSSHSADASGVAKDTPVGARPSGSDVQDQWVKYVACMKSHGVATIEAVPGAKGGVRIGGPPAGSSKAEQEAFQARINLADRACKHLLHAQQSNVSAAEEARFRDGMYAFAKCVRRHGIDLPDPKIVRVAGGFDVSFPTKAGAVPAQLSPGWRTAEAACQSLNPLLQPPK